MGTVIWAQASIPKQLKSQITACPKLSFQSARPRLLPCQEESNSIRGGLEEKAFTILSPIEHPYCQPSYSERFITHLCGCSGRLSGTFWPTACVSACDLPLTNLTVSPASTPPSFCSVLLFIFKKKNLFVCAQCISVFCIHWCLCIVCVLGTCRRRRQLS